MNLTIYVLFIMVLALGAVIASKQARPQSGTHGDGHAQGHDIYKHWSPPGNAQTSCCNDSDCRPTRAYLDGDGRWRAWNGTLWLIVPWERVLPTDHAKDGRSHLCEKGEFVYCFTPGQVRG